MQSEDNKKYDILFAIMAVQEVVFFGKMACRLRDEYGLKITFLLFHEAGDSLLDKMGIDYYSFHKLALKENAKAAPEEIDQILTDYKLQSLEDIYRHEMLTTNRMNRDVMADKVVRYFKAMDKFLKSFQITCIVQELGGFIAPQVLFHTASAQKIDHVFIEPAVFKQKVVFTLNTLYADIPDYNVPGNFTQQETTYVEEYLADALDKKPIVIPHKDRLFFQDMNLKRLLAPVNFQKLGRKLYHKYVLRKHEEYNAIGWYVAAHVIKLFSRKRLAKFYTGLDELAEGNFIYFPLHVPLDVQLTVRCPEYLDQLSFVRKVAQSLPEGYKLCLKEHPASIGAYPLEQMKSLLTNGNIKLIHPSVNSFDIVKKAAAVITINSKVGIESLMQRKPVVVAGKCFYKHKGVTFDADNLAQVKDAIKNSIGAQVDYNKVKNLFLKIYQWSYAGELYENSPENVDKFYNSLVTFLHDKVKVL